jgi:hypothetical protein
MDGRRKTKEENRFSSCENWKKWRSGLFDEEVTCRERPGHALFLLSLFRNMIDTVYGYRGGTKP